MAAARIDLPVTRGDDEVYRITRRYKSTGLGVDLSSHTGYTATIRTTYGGSSLGTMTVTDTDDDEGILVLTLSKTVSATFTGDEVWDLQWTTPSGLRRTAYRGRMLLEKDVT